MVAVKLGARLGQETERRERRDEAPKGLPDGQQSEEAPLVNAEQAVIDWSKAPAGGEQTPPPVGTPPNATVVATGSSQPRGRGPEWMRERDGPPQPARDGDRRRQEFEAERLRMQEERKKTGPLPLASPLVSCAGCPVRASCVLAWG